MYTNFKSEGYNPILMSHQIYFIQRWGELLDNGPVHYRKLVKPSLRSVLKETLQVISHFKSNVLREYNVFEIFEELQEVLKSNKVLKQTFFADFELLEERIKLFCTNKQSFSELKNEWDKYKRLELFYTLITALFNKLENTDIPRIYANYAVTEMSKEKLSFDKVDEILELLVGELIYEGHHKQYLFNWGRGVFITDSEPSFLKRLERIGELGNKNKRNFECFISLKLPDGYRSLFEQAEGRITFHKNVIELRTKFAKKYSLEEQYSEGLDEFFKEEKQIARIIIDATDEVAAINSAREELISTTKLFTLEKQYKLYDPGNLSDAVIYDCKGNQFNPKPYIESYQHGIQLSNNEKYIKINLESKMNKKYQGLDQLLQWCRVIQDSPRETGLVAMWSLLEYLFVTDPSNKRGSILEYATPYICHFYLKSIAHRMREILKGNKEENTILIEETKKQFGNNAIDNRNNEIKLHYLIELLAKNKQCVIDVYDNKIVEQRYIGLISKYVSLRGKKLWLNDFLIKLNNQVHSDFLRAYRLRNILAHQASMEEEYLDEVYRVIAFYLKLIIDDLLYTITLQPNNSVHDLVKIKKESYVEYLKGLNGLDSMDDIDFKKIINTKSLLV
ncbi:hypothetical protein ACOQFO_03595 [Ureibacillus sp. MALMAid1270]|uniref:hypothetical protein n=1 Tax=Ureibacillus sp. MALMAid1270 TaxID=3411629 RepID=UPI003BA666CA